MQNPVATSTSSHRGVHSYWSAPSRVRNREHAYGTHVSIRLPPYELLTTVLSLKTWKRFEGPMVLHGDSAAISALDEFGLPEMYDEVRTDVLDAFDVSQIDAKVFFNAGKIAVYGAETIPFTHLDMDLFLLTALPKEPCALRFAHWEAVATPGNVTYPPVSEIPLPRGFEVDSRWDVKTCAANLSIVSFYDDELRRAYVDRAMAFMLGNFFQDTVENGAIARAMFAEQRMPLLEAKRLGKPVLPVVNSCWDHSRQWIEGKPIDGQFHFHTWIRKIHFAVGLKDPNAYCLFLMERLLREFPECRPWVEKQDSLAPAYQAFRRGERSGPPLGDPFICEPNRL